ncbi:MAG: ankyrin repeat domain-containing protein [Candidatus Babeliales bacterium]
MVITMIQSIILCISLTCGSCAFAMYSLQDAIGHDDFELFTTLIRQAVDVNQRDWSGETPLTLASSEGKIQFVKALLDPNKENAQSAEKIEINRTNSSGFTALHRATIEKYPEIICLLLANSADSFFENDSFRSPIETLGFKYGAYMQRPLPLLDDYYSTRDSFFILLNAMHTQSPEKSKDFLLRARLHETVDRIVRNWKVRLDSEGFSQEEKIVLQAHFGEFKKFEQLAKKCIKCK